MAENTILNGYIGGITKQQLDNEITTISGLIPLIGTSGAIGGNALVAFGQTSSNVAVTGATSSMASLAMPAVFPGNNVRWSSYVVANDIVQVVVANTSNVNVTPTSTTYAVRVIQ
jgi:hypothetical protein